MRFDTTQQMRLGQQMKLAPRMIQSMEILQMPMLALQERIEHELESNIALEQAEPGADGEVDVVREDAAPDVDDQRELVVGDDTTGNQDDWARLNEFERSYGEEMDNQYSSGRFSVSRMSGERDRKMDAMANIAARGESLTEQLTHQWRFAEVDEETTEIGERLISYIDDDGLLSTDLETILEQNRFVPGVELTMERMEQTLAALQHWLDPPGMAARDAREALLIQVDHLAESMGDAEHWEDVRVLIADHFDDLLQNRLPRIAQKSELPIDRIVAAKELMRRLNPTPGRDLVQDEPPPIIPDIVIEFDEINDQYLAGLADGFLPTLRISKRYEALAKDRSQEKETREFAGNNVRTATWLIEAINQRKSTLLRVVNVVLARQREFFDHGPQHLKPMPMIEVADQLGIHVGTVSRAVAEKWMATPRGMFPLRMFFAGGTETESGRDMSWEAVKATLREIIDDENKNKPLSDEAIAGELKKRGIDIARRTVVKYRQQLDIPPARRRRQY